MTKLTSTYQFTEFDTQLRASDSYSVHMFEVGAKFNFAGAIHIEPGYGYYTSGYVAPTTDQGGAPDLIIEMVSPTSAYYDLIAKKEIYEKFGVREYWIVDPKKQWVELYLNVGDKFKLHQRLKKEGMVTSEILKGFQVSLEKIFSLE